MHMDDLQTVNFESYNTTAGQTYDEGISGVLFCDITFGGDWDAHTNPLGTTPGLYPRDDLNNLQFMVNRLDNVPWTFTFARLRQANNSGTVKDKVLFDCVGMSQGPFTFPAGSV